MPNLIYQIDTISEQLDEIDAEIMKRYPEIEHAWLHNTIAAKVKLEIEYAKLHETK